MYLIGSTEYVNALTADHRRRYERTAPPRRVEGRRRLDLPARLLPRRDRPDVDISAA